MSRGLGSAQRMIMLRLEREPFFYLADLLPEGYDIGKYQALKRAAATLEEGGRIVIFKFNDGDQRVMVLKSEEYLYEAVRQHELRELRRMGIILKR